MTQEQKDAFMKYVRGFFDDCDPDNIKWLAFVMKTNSGRIALASENAPKSTKLCD